MKQDKVQIWIKYMNKKIESRGQVKKLGDFPRIVLTYSYCLKDCVSHVPAVSWLSDPMSCCLF